MRVDRRIRFEYATNGRGNLRIKIYPDMCGRGPRQNAFSASMILAKKNVFFVPLVKETKPYTDYSQDKVLSISF